MKGSGLPASAIALAYAAAGFCLFTSGMQMHEVFAAHEVSGNGSKPLMICMAILLGGSVMWRLLGHLKARKSAAFATLFVALAAFYTEGMSITTSAMSLTTGVNARLVEDQKQSSAYKATKQANDAATMAVQRLSQNLANMPKNYITKGNETAAQINGIMQQQKELLKLQKDSASSESATARTLSDIGQRFGLTPEQVKYRWALGIALALSLIPLATQLAMGTLSDSELLERLSGKQKQPVSGGNSKPSGKVVRLHQ